MLTTPTITQSNQVLLQHKTHGEKEKISHPDIKKNSAKKLELFEINHNKKCDFINSDSKISCRHLSLYALRERFKNNTFKICHAFKDAATIIEKLGSQQQYLELQVDNAHRIADEAHILCNKKGWHSFLEAQFVRLQENRKENRFFCLLNTSNHTMMLEGLIGRNNQGKTFYRLKFYEPNRTVITRTVESTLSSKIFNKTLRDFLSAKDFVEIEANVVAVLVYYQNNPWQIKEQPVFNTQLTFTYFTPEILFIIMKDGFTKGLEQFLTLANSEKDINEMLNAKSVDGETALFIGMRENHYDTVEFLITWLIAQHLNSTQLLHLLFAEDTSIGPALHVALAFDKKESVEVFIKACKHIVAEERINIDELIRLLSAKDKNSFPGLYIALEKNNFKSITTFMETILDIPELDSDAVVELFLARDPYGRPGLSSAFDHGSIHSIKAFTDVCVQAFTREKINISQLMDLLSAKDRSRKPSLHYALSQGKSSAVGIFMAQLISFLRDNKLNLSQCIILMAAEDQGQLGIETTTDSKTLKIYRGLLLKLCNEREELTDFREAFSSPDESTHFLKTILRNIQSHVSSLE